MCIRDSGIRSLPWVQHLRRGDPTRGGEDESNSRIPYPDTPKKIREFIGLANYFRFLLPGFAEHSARLTDLFKKDSDYKSGPLPDQALRAFQALQSGLASNPLVAHPSADKDFILTSDAATGDSEHPGGMGAVLSQMHDGQERVIAYASRGLKPNEKNYSAYLLELAAACLLYTSPSPRD